MGKSQQKQGQSFEARVSKALNDLRREGRLNMVHKFVNAVGTPADFLAVGRRIAYLIECKNLVEGAHNKGYSLRLSCLTDNEWAGMRAWKGMLRKSFVVWNMIMLDGNQYTYAAPFALLDQAQANGVKHLRVDCGGVLLLGANGELNINKLFEVA